MIHARVIHGVGRGKRLGAPTLNLDAKPELPYGVYAVRVTHKKDVHPGVMNWGSRPTFKEEEPVMEVHLLDTEGDFYGEEVNVAVVGKVRDVQSFSSPELLTLQIRADIETARKLLL